MTKNNVFAFAFPFVLLAAFPPASYAQDDADIVAEDERPVQEDTPILGSSPVVNNSETTFDDENESPPTETPSDKEDRAERTTSGALFVKSEKIKGSYVIQLPRLSMHTEYVTLNRIPRGLLDVHSDNDPSNVIRLPGESRGKTLVQSFGTGVLYENRFEFAMDAEWRDSYHGERTAWSDRGFSPEEYAGYRIRGWAVNANTSIQLYGIFFAKVGFVYHFTELQSGTDANDRFTAQKRVRLPPQIHVGLKLKTVSQLSLGLDEPLPLDIEFEGGYERAGAANPSVSGYYVWKINAVVLPIHFYPNLH